MPTNNLEYLKKFFYGGSGSAERERKIRSIAFVDTSFVKLVTSKISDPFIVIKSPKGIGKSYICDELSAIYNDSDKISISISPTDIDTDQIAKCESMASKIRCAYSLMLKLIAIKIGSMFLDEKIPLRPEELNLYNLAVSSESQRPDITDILLKLIVNSVPFYSKLADAWKKSNPEISSNSVLKYDVSKVLDRQGKIFYLFIDDIDLAIKYDDVRVSYEDCWAIIAAAFDISSKLDCVHCIVSVRNDVWHTMKSKRIGSDRRDKISTVLDLNCTDIDIDNIIKKRFNLATRDSGVKEKKDIEIFFKEPEIELPGKAGIKRNWFSWFVKQSRNRPRDAVQLVSKILECAYQKNRNTITTDIAQSILIDFSKSRLENAASEYYNICNAVEFIVKKIDKTRYTYNEAIEFFKKIPSMRSISYEGNIIQPSNNDDAIKLLHVLHMANIMNPRYKDENASDGYGHFLYSGNEDLVTPENAGILSQYVFEVHPVFHSLIKESKIS